MKNLDSARNDLLFEQLMDILDSFSPEFLIPWKVSDRISLKLLNDQLNII